MKSVSILFIEFYGYYYFIHKIEAENTSATFDVKIFNFQLYHKK